MKNILSAVFVLLVCAAAFAADDGIVPVKERPPDFVDVKKEIPKAEFDIRYFSEHNFVGRRINGYLAPKCLLPKRVADALKKVEEKLSPMGLTIKIFDCYRPQTAVDDFAAWAKDVNDTKMRAEFYPDVAKADLFKKGYIAYRSGHSRGAAVDLTIDGLDMGSGFDFFGEISHPDYAKISDQARANRLLLQTLMIDAGFQPLPEEWWHFKLADEVYPKTYFDFPVE